MTKRPRRTKYGGVTPTPEPVRPAKVATATSETQYTDDEVEFFKAMERYKRENKRPFPTLREILLVVRSLGYRKACEAIR